MQIGFQSPHAWAELNDQATAALDLATQSGMAMVMPGVGAALAELTAGLARQYAHRKKVFYIKSADPALEEAALQMSKEGCQVQALDVALLGKPDELKAVLDGQSLLVLASEDDPLTGRCFDLTHVEAITESKKIFLLKLSNQRFRYSTLPQQYSRNTYFIFRIDQDLAVVLTNSRVKWPVQFANRLQLASDALDRVSGIKSIRVAQENLVREFEKKVPSGGKAVWDASIARVWDRAVVFWADMDSWAIATAVSKRMGLRLPALGQASLLESTSLNRWAGVRTMDWLYGLGFTPEMIRGTLIVDQELLVRREFAPALDVACSEIRAIQTG